MGVMHRWWDRHGLQMVLVGLVLGTAWVVRETQSALILELYQQVSRPFQMGMTQEERLVNAQVLELQQQVLELESQNQKFQELLGHVAAAKQPGVVAPVIGRSADNWWQQITLGRGKKDGIDVGFIVTAPGGVVGRVTHVTPRSSRVLLVSDPSSRVGVTISRSRYTGFMRGQANNRAVMEFFDKVPDIRQGDVVVTSAFSQLFPSGIPIGRIESINLNKSPAPEAVIELSAPISYLEWVVVRPAKPALPADSLPVEETTSSGENLF